MSETKAKLNKQAAIALHAALANARQTIDLLKSQLRAGMIDKDYWMARLDSLGGLLENLTQERASADQQRQLAALYEVSKLLGSSLDLQQVLSQTMDAIIQLTGAERGFLMMIDDNGELEIKAARNLAKETVDQDEFKISKSVIRTVAETGEQVVTTNASEDPRFANQASVMMHNLRSIQCVPLRARGRIIGVVYVDNRIHSGVFDEGDLELLSAFTNQAAVAIENARLFTNTDEALAARVSELSIMQAIDRQLNETLDFANIMNLTLDWAMRITHASNGVIGLLDVEDGKMQIVAQNGMIPYDVSRLLADGDDTNKAGVATMPIQREGTVIGIIVLDHEDQSPFSQEAKDFLHRLADHAATSIENARLYQAVQAANKAKSEFVSVVTHELRIPMTSIKGYTDMIRIAGQVNDQQKDFLDIIRSNVDRMNVLVSDLSDVSRIESGRLAIEVDENVNLRAVLDSLMPAMQAEIDRREHKVDIDFSDKLPTVRADPARVTQILVNLVSNAYKYTPNGGTITIRARKDGTLVRCEIADTGVGMSPEDVSKLFTKFWRADDVYVREQPGTGLGLTIVKNLVELQGGQMVVTSEKGVGTTFSFTLPVSAS
jgi:signal transduction histidine kinase